MEQTTPVFECSKSGEETCRIQGKYLHSKYNPTSEGERFAALIRADFSPLCILLLEPALAYCAPFIRKRFPSVSLCAIRFSDDFSRADHHFDFVFHDSPALSDDLFDALGEEKLSSCLALDWNPSKALFPQESAHVWNAVKAAVLKARDVIGTRAYFSKRWLKNALIFASRVQHAGTLSTGECPIIIAASGPSLASSLPFLKAHRPSFFLIALSSAYLPLATAGITPDVVISSDGGYWAKKHLAHTAGTEKPVFALEGESAVPSPLFSERAIVPLSYPNGLETAFFDAAHIPHMRSERNGTVAGTALQFALSLTSGSVYLCGLDQAPASGFQHTQPNALENGAARHDGRLRPTETRLTRARFSSEGSLALYRAWFVSHSASFARRVFRLSDNERYAYPLGSITEVNWSDFLKREAHGALKKRVPQFCSQELSPENRATVLLDTLRSLSKTSAFTEEVFPADALLLKREQNEQKRSELLAQLDKKRNALIAECTALVQSKGA